MTASSYLLEICVDSAAGVRAAADHGAHRIELCDALALGGLTPSAGLMRLAADCGCPTRAMIRPRAGDFIYGDDEIDVMRGDIDTTAEIGLAGVVFGANLVSGELDVTVLETLVEHARGLDLEIALHRSFDLAPDPLAALDTAIALGFDTVLTSGGAKSAALGTAVLRALVERAGNRIEILAGSGINVTNLGDILNPGVRAVHASASATVAIRSPRAAALGYATPDQRDTDPLLVAGLRAALDQFAESRTHVVC